MSALPPADHYVESICPQPDSDQGYGAEEFEYLRQPLTDPSPRVVIQKAAQVGATVLATVRALYFFDAVQANSMYLLPTHRSAARFSRGRFQALLEHSRYLGRRFHAVRNAAHLRSGSTNFYCHGARSRIELLSTPVQYLTLDERDALHSGDPLGKQPWSAVDLARQRLSGQRDSWELNLSTPTVPGHGIHAEFELSDQHEFHLYCPHCRRHVLPTWPEAIQDASAGPAGGAAFVCVGCRQPWTEADRREAIRRGRWTPRFARRTVRGYHLTQLAAPAARAERILRQWRESCRSELGRQAFFNNVLGLPYLVEGARLEQRYLDEAVRRGGHAMKEQAADCVLGVDVGPNWLHAVVAEQAGDALRIVWVGRLVGWAGLDDLWQRFRVRSFVIDALPETHLARSAVRRHGQGWLCYYQASGPGRIDVAARTVHVPRTETLDAMFARWRCGRVLAPADLPAEFGEHLRAPARVLRFAADGQPRAVYQEAGAPDHFAHALNYCEIALALAGAPPRFLVTLPRAAGEVG